ncbi:MAG: SIMPL domain-containing protein [Cyanobacteria bacterium CRU_2_1]|nr:SIMPL domain-containing protein [Cyanobacteria bacterium CRU_2_1]
MEFIFIGYDPYYDPYAYPTIPPVEEVPTSEETPSSGADPSVETIPAPIPEPSYPPEPEPLSRADLQPVIDALVAAGIPASAIEVSLPSDGAANPYYSYYYPGSVTVSFSVSQPSRERVREIVATVEESVSGSERMYLQDRLVQYTIDTSRCDALIREAYTAALTDARDRATLLAEIIGVEIGDTPSVSDFAGYFTPTLSPCDAPSNYIYTYASPTYYDPSAPTEVQLQRGVFVSYPIE